MSERMQIPCPECGATLKVSAEAVGRRIRCPKCQHTFRAESPATAPAAQSSPAKKAAAAESTAGDPWDEGGSPDGGYEEYGDDGFEEYESADDSPAPPRRTPRTPAKKPARRTKSAGASRLPVALPLGFVGWLIGGGVAGLIGAAIWGGIVYATDHEIGWIAWGIGALVGFGVRVTAGESEGTFPGLTAGGLALLSVLAGKFFAVSLLVDKVAGGLLGAGAKWQILMQNGFGPYDLLWFGLAAFTAFKVGGGAADGE